MIGISLNSPCLKKMERRVGIKRKISQSKRCWSGKLIKPQLPHPQREGSAPGIPEVVPSDPSRQSRMAPVRETMVRVWLCPSKSPETETGFTLALQASISRLEILQALHKYSSLFTPGDRLLQNQAPSDSTNETLSTPKLAGFGTGGNSCIQPICYF